MKNGKFQIGIIGCGGIAGAHASTYKCFDNVEVVALADIIPGKAKAFGERNGFVNARCYDGGHLELLENEKELDAVSICTYNRQHAPCVIAALEAGINVLVEKPMSVTLEEACDMVRAEKKSGKILSVGFQPRFANSMIKMKDIVRSGELGKVYYIQTGGGRRRGIPGSTFIEDKTAGVGALGDIGCYSLDMCLDAIGYPKPLTVTAYKSDWFGKDPSKYDEAYRFSVDDFAAAFIRLEGGIILDFRISWAMNIDSPGDTIFFGTDGGLRIPATDCWNGSFGDMTLYKTVGGKDLETVIPSGERNNCWIGKIGSFLNAIEKGGPSPVPTKQILYNQAIIDAIVRSAKLGKEVEVVIPEDLER